MDKILVITPNKKILAYLNIIITTESYFAKEGLNIQFTQGNHYVGVFIRSPNMKQNWLQATIQQWETNDKILSKIAAKYHSWLIIFDLKPSS